MPYSQYVKLILGSTFTQLIDKWEVPSHNIDCLRNHSNQRHTENYSTDRSHLLGTWSNDHTPGDTQTWSLRGRGSVVCIKWHSTRVPSPTVLAVEWTRAPAVTRRARGAVWREWMGEEDGRITNKGREGWRRCDCHPLWVLHLATIARATVLRVGSKVLRV